MICEICGESYVLKNKHGGHPKKRPTCGKQRCQNRWTWLAKHDENKQKKLNAYRKNMLTRPEYVRAINRKANARRRYGVDDRESLLKKHNGVCENCGIKKSRLVIHHIDNNGRRAEMLGEKANNDPQNIMLVCDSCHVSHHVYNKELKKRYSPI